MINMACISMSGYVFGIYKNCHKDYCWRLRFTQNLILAVMSQRIMLKSSKSKLWLAQNTFSYIKYVKKEFAKDTPL